MVPPESVIGNKDGTVTLAFACISCPARNTVTVPFDAYKDWVHGKLVEDAFPELSADERELMISGMCGGCFDYLLREFDEMSEE